MATLEGSHMTGAQIVALGIRLFCIWFAFYLLRLIPGLFLLNARETVDPAYISATAVLSFILLLIIIGLWRYPLTVAKKLIPDSGLEHPTSLRTGQVESIGFCLLGLWLLSSAIPQIVYVAVIVYHSTRPNSMVSLEPHNYAAMARMVAELGIGLWLLFGAKGLRGLLYWARYAGTGEPSNPTPHSDAREASHLGQPSQPRAGGRERLDRE